jgi:hypothetical protein
LLPYSESDATRRLGKTDAIGYGLHADAIRRALGNEVEHGFDDLLLACLARQPRPGSGDIDGH